MKSPSGRTLARTLAAILSCVLLSGAAVAATAAADPAPAYASRRVSTPEDLAAIGRVVDEFAAAIKAKNGKQLSSLVLNSRILFTSPLDQAKVDGIRAYDANFDGVGFGGFLSFARYISTTEEAVEEKFHNVQIAQDGPLGWVLFDYEFVADGKLSNYGVEHWQLRKIDGRWKIFSVIWTTHEPAQ